MPNIYPICNTDNPDKQNFCGECTAPLQLAKDVNVTRTIESYVGKLIKGTSFAERDEPIEELGKGEMVRVYRV